MVGDASPYGKGVSAKTEQGALTMEPVIERWRGPFTRWPRASDIVLAVVVFVAAVLLSFGDSNEGLSIRAFDEVGLLSVVAAAVASGSLVWRRTHPLIALGVVLAIDLVPSSLVHSEATLALPFALYAAGRYADNDRWNYILMGLSVLALTVEGYVDDPDLTGAGFGILFLFGIWYLGRRSRARRSRAVEMAQQRASEIARTVAEERTRIARELHDVVAHRVSLMTVQAGAARTVVDDDPAAARRAIEAVEQAGREVLGELRHLLGVLRPQTELTELAPQPGLHAIPELVEEFESAGLPVELTVLGDEIDLPARVDLSVYRITQEALTNVLRHAGSDASARVTLTTNVDEVVLDVVDDGDGPTSVTGGSGHGIVGMRERAQILGGTLIAGPRPQRGFQVKVHIPLKGND